MSIVRLTPLGIAALLVSGCVDPLGPDSRSADMFSADVVSADTEVSVAATTGGQTTVGTCGTYVVAYGPTLIASPTTQPSSTTCGGN